MIKKLFGRSTLFDSARERKRPAQNDKSRRSYQSVRLSTPGGGSFLQDKFRAAAQRSRLSLPSQSLRVPQESRHAAIQPYRETAAHSFHQGAGPALPALCDTPGHVIFPAFVGLSGKAAPRGP